MLATWQLNTGNVKIIYIILLSTSVILPTVTKAKREDMRVNLYKLHKKLSRFSFKT